jgi:thiamine-phosphate pyrophosphorylase
LPILDISLHGIIDPQVGRGRDLAAMARIAALNGATLIQYRNKDGTTREMLADAIAIHAALAGTGVPLIINDRVDVALAMDADGVHLGQGDMPFADARRLLGTRAIIGATVKSAADLEAIPHGTVSYACIGGVFDTAHKDNSDRPLGVAAFAALRAMAYARFGNLPVGAIAGINASNLGALIHAGADGVAVIGAMFADDDVAAATAALARAIAEARS